MLTNAWRSLFLQVLAVSSGQGEPGTLLLRCNSIPVRQDAGGHALGSEAGACPEGVVLLQSQAGWANYFPGH